MRVDPGRTAVLAAGGATRGVVSWNSMAPSDALALQARFADGGQSAWIPYVRWDAQTRRSENGSDAGFRVAIDVIESTAPLAEVGVRAQHPLDLLAFASPFPTYEPSTFAGAPFELDVPALSQYGTHGERGWCSAASSAMLLGATGIACTVEQTAHALYDTAYGGTGNWAFNMAFLGRHAVRAFVAYLRDLEHARRVLARGRPIAVSYAWRDGELEGAPLTESAGHLVVLRGFTSAGDPIVNDPARSEIRVVYPRVQLEAVWQRNDGVAYVIADREDGEIANIVNG